MILEPFDLATAPEADARAAFALAAAVHEETAPEDPTPHFGEWVEGERLKRSWEHHARFVMWNDARTEVLGMGEAGWETTDSNKAMGEFDVAVRADARRRGIGRALLVPVLDALEAAGRTQLYSGTWEGSKAGAAFLEALALQPKLWERKSRCVLADVDRPMLEAWVARAKQRADRYSLLAWEGVAPDEHLAPLVDVLGVMNTAPLEDFEMEDEIFTAEMMRESERISLERKHHWLTAVVRHDDTGEFAGFTQVGISPWHPEQVHQWGTATRPTHRDRGIGRWLKAAMTLRLLDEFRDARYIDTWNAGSNRPMLAINEAMGFRPLQYWINYQATLDEVRTRLAA